MTDNTSQPNLFRAIQNIFMAAEDDVSCDEAASLMANFIDNYATSANLANLSPRLNRHFQVGRDCEAEFQMSMTMAQEARRSNKVSDPSQIPTRPDKKSLLTPIREAVDFLFSFPGFPPAISEAVRGAGLNFSPVQITLNDKYMLEIDVGLDPNDSSLRNLFVSVLLSDDDELSELEGISVWLTRAGEDHYAATAMLDEYGEAILTAVEPSVSYFLQVMIPSQISRIQHIELP